VSERKVQASCIAVDATWLNCLPAIAGLLALALIAGYAFSFQELPVTANPAAWGAFGDYMGGLLNPLISLFTLVVAMKVWGLQKTELRETRKAVKEQGKTAEQQRREQRFFDLLNLYQETLKTLVIEGVSGKAALNKWHKLTFNAGILQQCLSSDGNSTNQHQTSNQEKTNYWNELSPRFDHYFRTIFSILKELEALLKEDHIRYAKLFRAQLSRDEVTLLAFHILFGTEGKKMRPLVEKYGLLKYLTQDKLRNYAIEELDPVVFGSQWAANHPAQNTPC
jgi:hypothetical protein